ncbi:MAG TPA: dihydrofolate reductase [Lentimicrobium sp.]|nr:dihydrofolate reductase [Lentimicrobium sp.]
MITYIVAIAQNGAIGCENRLLWHIPSDLKRFKAFTLGHTVIMGMATYHSLPVKPLKDRRNIVMTRNAKIELPGCEIAHSIEEALHMIDNNKENFIIGGAQIYKAFMPFVEKLMLTIVHKDFSADTFFPEIDFSKWQEVEREDVVDSCNLGFDYSYITYIRLR